MESVENKGIRATDTLKNEVASKTKPLFGLAKYRKPVGTFCAIFLNFFLGGNI
jgi:hypothetical protein